MEEKKDNPDNQPTEVRPSVPDLDIGLPAVPPPAAEVAPPAVGRPNVDKDGFPTDILPTSAGPAAPESAQPEAIGQLPMPGEHAIPIFKRTEPPPYATASDRKLDADPGVIETHEEFRARVNAAMSKLEDKVAKCMKQLGIR